jgi:hypothetical protein
LKGAAVGPLIVGPLSFLGWDYVFYFLMIASTMGMLVSNFFYPKEIIFNSNIVFEKLFVVTIVKNLSENYNNIVFSPQLLTRLIINEVKEKCHNRNTRAPENDRPTFNIQMK